MIALQWLAIGHLYWAGLGMYVLLRVLRWNGLPVSRPAALLAALAFQFSDPFLIHLGNLNLIAVLSWLPWVVAAYTRALEGRTIAWAALAGFLLALANYAGHAQSSVYIGLALVVFTLLWMWNDRRDPKGAGEVERSSATTAAAWTGAGTGHLADGAQSYFLLWNLAAIPSAATSPIRIERRFHWRPRRRLGC